MRLKGTRSVLFAAAALAALAGSASAQFVDPTSGEFEYQGQFVQDLATPAAPIVNEVNGVTWLTGGALFEGLTGTFARVGETQRTANYTMTVTDVTRDLTAPGNIAPGVQVEGDLASGNFTVYTTFAGGRLTVYRDNPPVPGQDYFSALGDPLNVSSTSPSFLAALPGFSSGAVVFTARIPSLQATVYFQNGQPVGGQILPGVSGFVSYFVVESGTPGDPIYEFLRSTNNLTGVFTGQFYFEQAVRGYSLRIDGSLDIVPIPQVPATLSVKKFYDTNVNGIKDAGEPFINGWQARITQEGPGGGVPLVRLTPATEQLPSTNTYTVAESASLIDTWVATTPTRFTGVRPTVAGTEVLFGNVCLGNDNLDARTIGYWQNKAGTEFAATQDALLDALNLVRQNGSAFNPDDYNFKSNAAGAWSYWLSQANASNMAYMLSAQMAGTFLNQQAGVIGSSLYVGGYFNGTPLATLVNGQNGLISISQLIQAASDELGLHPVTVQGGTGSAFRSYQERLKNLFDALNNDTQTGGIGTTFVRQPTQVNGIYTGPCAFGF